jgi:hypothetical protein
MNISPPYTDNRDLNSYLFLLQQEINSQFSDIVINVDSVNSVGNYYMINNTVPTVFSAVSTPTKALGTSTNNPLSINFSNGNNRLTYTGVLTKLFKVTAVSTLTTSQSNLQVSVYLAKNGVVIPESHSIITTANHNRAENVVVQSVVRLTPGDYIELWLANDTNTTDITAVYLNTIVEGLR